MCVISIESCFSLITLNIIPKTHIVTYLKIQKHQVDPRLRVARAHCKARLRVQTMRSSDLAREMQLGHLLGASLLDAAACRRRQPMRQLVHVLLDRGKVLLAELLHGVAHDLVRFERAHALVDDAVGAAAATGCRRVVEQCHAGVVVVATRRNRQRTAHDHLAGGGRRRCRRRADRSECAVDGQCHHRFGRLLLLLVVVLLMVQVKWLAAGRLLELLLLQLMVIVGRLGMRIRGTVTRPDNAGGGVRNGRGRRRRMMHGYVMRVRRSERRVQRRNHMVCVPGRRMRRRRHLQLLLLHLLHQPNRTG